MMKRIEARLTRVTTIGWAVFLSLLWILLLWWIVARLSVQTAFNRFHHLRAMDLNEIGDFLAGAFSPMALIWLVATVMLQRRSLSEAQEQFRISESNQFKLSLFDQRLKVKELFETGAQQLMLGDEVQGQGITMLWEAASAAEYIYGNSVRGALKEFIAKARQGRHYDLVYDRLQKITNRTDAQNAQMKEAVDGRYDIATWIIDNTKSENFNKMFRPYLQMPEPSEDEE